MIKKFVCEKCGEVFETEDKCFGHEMNCRQDLKDIISSAFYEYGITTDNIKINFESNTYITEVIASIPSGYHINFTFIFKEKKDITDDFIKKLLQLNMGKNFEGKLNNMADSYNGYMTYCANSIDLSLIGQVYEGHTIKIDILD